MEARAGPPMLSVVALFSFRKIVEIWGGSVRLRDDGSAMPSEGWPPGLFASTAGERINGITGSGGPFIAGGSTPAARHVLVCIERMEQF